MTGLRLLKLKLPVVTYEYHSKIRIMKEVFLTNLINVQGKTIKKEIIDLKKKVKWNQENKNPITNSKDYETRRLNAAFTRAL